MSTHSGFRIQDLPPELEREIFEIAARADMGSALQLVLVAKKIHLWFVAQIWRRVVHIDISNFRIRPIIYEMVTLGSNDTPLFLRTMAALPSSFLTSRVKRLCLTVAVGTSDASRILGVCSGIESLACWVDFCGVLPPPEDTPSASLISSIASLLLKRLSIEVLHFSDFLRKSQNFDCAWSSRLTHLDLVFWTPDDLPTFPGLESIPCLTHIGLYLREHVFTEHYISSMISRCAYLKIMAIVIDEDLIDDSSHPLDPRIVFLPYPEIVLDWEAPYRGLPDTWSRAELMVEEQLRKVASRWASFTRYDTKPDLIA